MILWISCKNESLLRYPRFLWVKFIPSVTLLFFPLGGGGGGCKRIRSTCGSARRGKKKTRRRSEATQRILSDVITTRALYTPLVYVFSRGWSVTSTTVRFHLRVLLCRLKYILTRAEGVTPLQCMEHGWQKEAERLLGAWGPTLEVGTNRAPSPPRWAAGNWVLEGGQCVMALRSAESLPAPLSRWPLTE